MSFPHDHEWENGLRGKDHLPPSPDYMLSLNSMLGIGIVTICIVGIVIIAVDDASGIGIADDYLFAPLIAFLKEGALMILK